MQWGENVTKLDPRVQDNAEKIKKLEEALLRLAAVVDGVAWRTSSPEERAGFDIRAEIRAILK